MTWLANVTFDVALDEWLPHVTLVQYFCMPDVPTRPWHISPAHWAMCHLCLMPHVSLLDHGSTLLGFSASWTWKFYMIGNPCNPVVVNVRLTIPSLPLNSIRWSRIHPKSLLDLTTGEISWLRDFEVMWIHPFLKYFSRWQSYKIPNLSIYYLIQRLGTDPDFLQKIWRSTIVHDFEASWFRASSLSPMFAEVVKFRSPIHIYLRLRIIYPHMMVRIWFLPTSSSISIWWS